MNRPACCDRFLDIVSIEGKEGLSIVPVNSTRFGQFFRLQYCAVPVGDMADIKFANERKVVLMVEQYIQFCPFCGTKLADFYKDTFFELPYLTIEYS